MVIMASGIARGRVRTTTTTVVELRKMAAILQTIAVVIFAMTTVIEVPDPLVVEDLISDKLNRRKLARLIKKYRAIFSNISECILLDVLLCGIADNFYSLFVI